jgi:hypothetical protein
VTRALSRRKTRCPRELVGALVALLGGCAASTDLGEACGERPDDVEDVSSHVPAAVDVLVVIDDTPATRPFVDGFADALPAFVRALLTGDHDGDGVPETLAIDSLHVGITTGDLGGGLVPLDGCSAGSGDDALMRSRGADPRCDGALPGRFLSLRRGDDLAAIDALRCVARGAGEGCTVAQPLEALLRAVSDAEVHSWDPVGAEAPRFLDVMGRELAVGHACPPGGGCPHEGFARPFAQHVAIVISAGDDCSVADPAVLDARDPRLADVPPPLRCAEAERNGWLRPVERLAHYATWPPWDLHVIAGVPSDVALPPGWTSLSVLPASDPRMALRLRADGASLEPSCTSEDGHEASPPRRLSGAVLAASSIGARTSLQSICASEPRTQLLSIAGLVARDAGGECLPPSTSAPASSPDECVLFEDLPVERAGGCEALPGRRPEGRYTDGVRVWERCRIDRLDGPDDARAGWYVDPSFGCGPRDVPRTAFSRAVVPVFGATLQLSCSRFGTLELRCDDDDDDAADPCVRGMRCTPGALDRCGTGVSNGVPLRCDPVERTCAIACTRDEDCRAAGAPERLCDLRSVGVAAAGEAVRSIEPIASEPRGVCVAAACEP